MSFFQIFPISISTSSAPAFPAPFVKNINIVKFDLFSDLFEYVLFVCLCYVFGRGANLCIFSYLCMRRKALGLLSNFPTLSPWGFFSEKNK